MVMLTVATNLILAVAMVECGGDASKVNRRHGAYGPLQIRQMCLDDVNRYAGTHYTLRQFVGNTQLSKWAFEVYADMYNETTPDGMVTLWHYGPRGRHEDHGSDDYVRRVMNLYNDLNRKDGGQ
jgi:hypothetical protein